MGFTSKLVTTAAIAGAAAGIYAYKQINKNNLSSDSSNASNSNTYEPKTQTFSATTTGDTPFNTVETKTVTGYSTTPINTPEGNVPVTEFDSVTYPITGTDIKTDVN